MSGNDSVSLSQLAPGPTVVSSQGGGGGALDLPTNGGVVYQKLTFRTDDVNATPMTGYGDDSPVATGITEDGSVIFAGGGAARGMERDKWGKIIRTCGIAGCQHRCRSSHMKYHKASKHGIDVVWFSCDQEGCGYKAKQAGTLKKHKRNIHDIDVRWYHCDQDGCDYKAKAAGHLKLHKADIHDIDVRWHRCDQDGCNYKAKQASNLKRHMRCMHS
ncbi:hypothetical protein TrST_g7945 [Triparma strigata]|uniref:C2H2-type domain-containing protein n=1 Tax=Triparma strigata TaxID=1606541 RepID=A0A9W7BWZ0_9STRA|nr:hypothetical protein TrST_g7945 [Triparma strigata]